MTVGYISLTFIARHNKLMLKAEFYGCQRELYSYLENDDRFKEILRYTKLMDLPRRNELYEEYA